MLISFQTNSHAIQILTRINSPRYYKDRKDTHTYTDDKDAQRCHMADNVVSPPGLGLTWEDEVDTVMPGEVRPAFLPLSS